MINTKLQRVCDDFIDYRLEIRDMTFFKSYSQLYPLCAYIFMMRNQEPNEEIMHLCKEIIRENNGIFSMFRGNAEKAMTALLACESDPGTVMELSEEAYRCLREEFSASHYLPILAYYMATSMSPERFEQFAYDTRTLYDHYNDMHPILTSEEDSIFIGLLNATGRNFRELVNETEEIWSDLKSEFRFHKDALQTAAHALTLCRGEGPAKAARFYNLFTRLRSEGYRFGKDYEMVPLAILANLGIDPEQIFMDFVECEQYLYECGGYGFWAGLSTQSRYMHTVLVLSVYYHNSNSELTAAFIVSVLMEIAREQAAAAAAAA